MWHALLTRTGAALPRARSESPPPARPAAALELTELEDRILMSAVPLAPEAMLDPDSENDADLPESAGQGASGPETAAATMPRQPSDAAISDSTDQGA
jgi:hypothetical protein